MSEEIIDGVNVWSCKHYDLENNYCDQSYLGEGGLLKNTKRPKRCESNPNCYYKQLKRLQAENERLKEEIKTYDKAQYEEFKRAEEYRKALEEIRETASAIINGKHITNDIEGHLKELSKLIIDKINEVLNER